jgi:hypothetical protein
MTETEWLACTDPEAMLEFMFERASRRKIELYTSGSYRSVSHLLPDARFRNKLDVRERYFDGLATAAELDAALRAADEVPHQLVLQAWDSIGPQRQVQILRDLFGNPFRPAAADPPWLTPAARGLAQAIYDARAFDRMPELADALQTAGCADADLLAHCRGPGPHVRGCWAVDLVLELG